MDILEKIDEKIDNSYITPPGQNVKEVLKNSDNMWYNQLKDAYFGVSDNINKLNVLLAPVHQLSSDYRNIKSALQYFKKLEIGKYL